MAAIETYCTIVNLLVEDGDELVVQPSGWSDADVISTLKKANVYLKSANVEFKFMGVKTQEVTLTRKDGLVDGAGLEELAFKVGATAFVPGKVKAVFMRKFSGTYRGRSIQEWCFSCVQRPLTAFATEGPMVLAHELGHLVGLGHECTDQGRLMHYAWLSTQKAGLSKEEIATIKAHAHVDRSVTFVAPTVEEPSCRS